MADAYANLLDLAKKTGSDAVVGLIEQNLLAYPEARLFPSRTITGTSFKTYLRTDYPDPVFRAVNEGTDTKKSTFQNKLVECFFLDGQLQIDEATVGADDNAIASQMTIEADGMTKGILRRLGKQVWYGTGLEDAKGFPGAVQIVDPTLTVDAGGTTDNVASSVYLVNFGQQAVQFVFGNGNVFSMPAWQKQRIEISSKHLMAWVSNISGWTGVQWVNNYSVGRIKKLTTDAGKGLTDSLVAKLLSQLPDDADLSNARLFMTRRSAYQLQISRTPTSITTVGGAKISSAGVETIAPFPTESNGIPIVLTSSIRNIETLAL